MYKLKKGDSFQTFYYMALSMQSSCELREFIKLNQWYFDRQEEPVKQQLRDMYEFMRGDELNGEEVRCK